MPASYLARHRPICTVLQEIRGIAETREDHVTMKLCDEATGYAQRMSAKLTEYKEAKLAEEKSLRSLLEVGAGHKDAHLTQVQPHVALSQAISLKRIADALEKTNEYGEIGFEAIAGTLKRMNWK